MDGDGDGRGSGYLNSHCHGMHYYIFTVLGFITLVCNVLLWEKWQLRGVKNIYSLTDSCLSYILLNDKGAAIVGMQFTLFLTLMNNYEICQLIHSISEYSITFSHLSICHSTMKKSCLCWSNHIIVGSKWKKNNYNKTFSYWLKLQWRFS